MKPIWYFVGLLLLIMGALIALSGIVGLINPPEHQTMYAHLHPDLWWGVLMVVVGALFLVFNRKKTVG